MWRAWSVPAKDSASSCWPQHWVCSSGGSTALGCCRHYLLQSVTSHWLMSKTRDVSGYVRNDRGTWKTRSVTMVPLSVLCNLDQYYISCRKRGCREDQLDESFRVLSPVSRSIMAEREQSSWLLSQPLAQGYQSPSYPAQGKGNGATGQMSPSPLEPPFCVCVSSQFSSNPRLPRATRRRSQPRWHSITLGFPASSIAQSQARFPDAVCIGPCKVGSMPRGALLKLTCHTGVSHTSDPPLDRSLAETMDVFYG